MLTPNAGYERLMLGVPQRTPHTEVPLFMPLIAEGGLSGRPPCGM